MPYGKRAKRRGTILVLLLTLLALGALPTTSHAAETVAANYRVGALQFAAGNPINNCRGWSGDADRNGHFYIPCAGAQNPLVYEFDKDLTFLRVAQLPAAYLYDGTYRMRDVTVSPDGATMYVSTGPIIDNLGVNPVRNGTAYAGAVLRMKRQADGSWAWDNTFRTGPYQFGGNYWSAREVDVDALGRLYVSVNGYVYEISPTTGGIVTAFGGIVTNGAGGAWREGLDVAQGIAVSGDGSSIFVIEQRHHLLQRWVRVGATNWRRDTTWGPNGNGLIGEPSVVNAAYCTRRDRLQSPYDVALDGAGDVYVMDTGCRRVQRFTAAGAFVQTVWANGPDGELNHGFALNYQGSFILPNIERTATRLDPPAQPPVDGGGPTCVDTGAPTITGVSLPGRTTTRTIRIAVATQDDCSGVQQVSVSGSIAASGTWVNGTAATVTLTGTNGSTPLTISARDAKGRTATAFVRVTLAVPQPPLRSRNVVTLAGRGCHSGNPLKRVAQAKAYRVADRCAQLVGRVTAVRGRGAALQVLLQLDTKQAQAIYTNAVGSVSIWVIGDRRTRRIGAPKVGRRAVVVATIVAKRTRTASYAIPADTIRGR